MPTNMARSYSFVNILGPRSFLFFAFIAIDCRHDALEMLRRGLVFFSTWYPLPPPILALLSATIVVDIIVLIRCL